MKTAPGTMAANHRSISTMKEAVASYMKNKQGKNKIYQRKYPRNSFDKAVAQHI
jgi:hypothetical protein